MQQPASTTTSEKSLRLPKFNPDAAEADTSAWRKTADMILTEHPLEGSALVMSLSGALEGSACTDQLCWYYLVTIPRVVCSALRRF